MYVTISSFFFFLWIYFAHFLSVIFGEYSQFSLPSYGSFLHPFNEITQVKNHIFIRVQRVGGHLPLGLVFLTYMLSDLTFPIWRYWLPSLFWVKYSLSSCKDKDTDIDSYQALI